MYLADTLSRHFTGDEVHLTRSEFEEALEETSQIEEINQMVASGDKLSRLKDETDKDEVLEAVKAIIQSGWPESKSTVPLKSKLPPLVSFLTRRVSFLSRCVSFLARITEVFGMAYIMCNNLPNKMGLSKICLRFASIVRSIYFEQPSNVRGDIKLFSTEFALSGNTIVFNR